MHSNFHPQRPIAPKNTNIPTNSIRTPPSFHSSSLQPIQKNFQCRICRLTYKVLCSIKTYPVFKFFFIQNFHDCTAHIRRKHEISHVQAGRYVEKLDTDVPLPPSATGHYKIRVKVKSLPPPPPTTTTTAENFTKSFQCKYCSYTTPWLTDMSRHEKQKHRTYAQEKVVDNNNTNGFSELLIDNVQTYGEIIPNQNDEIIMIEEDIDDDEDEAYERKFSLKINLILFILSLWKYQQEINNFSISPTNSNKSFKKYQCPHCEHS